MPIPAPSSAEAGAVVGATSLAQRVAAHQMRIEAVLEGLLTTHDSAIARLGAAMRYCVLGGGKRLRPVLVYCTGAALGAAPERLDAAAAAVELIHVYSLVHDDLPAMDNDDLRRGRPTCHRAYDEATAILVGDALQALAFAVLADPKQPGPEARLRLAMIDTLARGIGTAGMAGGQAIDLGAVGRTLSPAALEDMHRRKTGALIQVSVLLGAAAAGLTDGPQYHALAQFGAEIGLAFQIQDDILDVEGCTEMLGKLAGADAARAKPTYPSTFGLAQAREQAAVHRDRAVAALEQMGERGKQLAELAHFVVQRVH